MAITWTKNTGWPTVAKRIPCEFSTIKSYACLLHELCAKYFRFLVWLTTFLWIELFCFYLGEVIGSLFNTFQSGTDVQKLIACHQKHGRKFGSFKSHVCQPRPVFLCQLNMVVMLLLCRWPRSQFAAFTRFLVLGWNMALIILAGQL